MVDHRSTGSEVVRERDGDVRRNQRCDRVLQIRVASEQSVRLLLTPPELGDRFFGHRHISNPAFGPP